MNVYEVARRIGECLDEDRIPYGIGGALALGIWGAPRVTIDVDISIFVPRAQTPRVLDALERAGVMLDREAAIRDIERVAFAKGMLGTTIVDVFLSEHPQYAAMALRVQRVADADGWFGAYISAEDITLHKLVYGRGKDLADLERLFATRPDLDVAYIRHWPGEMVPANDRRIVALDDLERRFSHR